VIETAILISLLMQCIATLFRNFVGGLVLQIPDNIRLIEQPAASPELNPVEHIWDDIREKDMLNRMFETLERVEQALEQGIQRLAALPEKLRSMTFFPHLRIEM
jgi:hypothetical protein